MAENFKRKQPNVQGGIGNGGKRQKYDGGLNLDDMPSSFEEELALFETIESESQKSEYSQESSQGSQKMNGNDSSGDGPAAVVGNSLWSRAAPPQLNPGKDKLVFQQLELDDYIGKKIAR